MNIFERLFGRKKSPIPKGIREIRQFLYIIIFGPIFFYLLFRSGPFYEAIIVILKPFIILPAIIWFVAGYIATLAILIGFKKRGEGFWKFTWVWFSLNAGVSTIFGIFYMSRSFSLDTVVSTLFGLLFWGLFAWYTYNRKDYFISKTLKPDFPQDKLEKNFKRLIWIPIIMIMALLLIPDILDIYLMTQYLFKMSEDRFNPVAGIAHCESFDGRLRDFCLFRQMDIPQKFGEYKYTPTYCDRINSVYYHDKCQLKFLNCDGVKKDGTKMVCLQLASRNRTRFIAKIRDTYIFSKFSIVDVCTEERCSTYVRPDLCEQQGDDIWTCDYYIHVRLSSQASERLAEATKELGNTTINDDAPALILPLEYHFDRIMIGEIFFDPSVRGYPVTGLGIKGIGQGKTKDEAYSDAVAGFNELKDYLLEE